VAASANSAKVSVGGYRGRNAERLGMCPAVVPVRTSLALPGRYAPVRWQIWQRMTGRCVTVTGKRRELELLITSRDAGPVGLTLRRDDGTRTPWGKRGRLAGQFSAASRYPFGR
jgi:hypothetical protein